MPPVGYQPFPQQQAMGTGQYGSWIARVGATIVDGIVAALFTAPAYIALLAGPKEIDFCGSGFEDGSLCRVPTGTSWALFAGLGALGVIGFLVLYCRKVGTTGQSWGHKVAGLRVVDAQTGSTIGGGRALGRYFARILSALPCYLGFLWPLWDARKQTFHDKIVGTVVVKA